MSGPATASTRPKPPMALLAELTHRCPLACPYCSNPTELTGREAELTTGQWADVFGQAAALVAATEALKKTDNAKYLGVQKERLAKAKKALQAAKGSVPEAGALLGTPTDAAARAFVAAIKDKDLSGALGGMLPKKDAYK